MLSADKIIGSGSEAVYLYYYENDRRLALLEGRDRWECKVGKSSSRSSGRVEDQIKTSAARSPVLAVEIRTDTAYTLESLMHGSFRARNIEGGAGSEWFMTNPDEFIRAYDDISERLDSVKDACPVSLDSAAYFIEDIEDWGFAIRQIRGDLGLTQDQLSKLSFTRQGTISDLERSRPMKLGTVWKALRAMGYSAVLIKPGDEQEE